MQWSEKGRMHRRDREAIVRSLSRVRVVCFAGRFVGFAPVHIYLIKRCLDQITWQRQTPTSVPVCSLAFLSAHLTSAFCTPNHPPVWRNVLNPLENVKLITPQVAPHPTHPRPPLQHLQGSTARLCTRYWLNTLARWASCTVQPQ